ncbi:MAG: hypothetical protein DRH70_08090, partial [Candidatus Coatesbacteria bacterium]
IFDVLLVQLKRSTNVKPLPFTNCEAMVLLSTHIPHNTALFIDVHRRILKPTFRRTLCIAITYCSLSK